MADFQRAVSCDVDACENPAQYQCLNCEDALCVGCKEKHENKRKNHKFVLYSEKAKRACKKHTGNKCIYWCEECHETCCSKCVITLHKGHDMGDIEEAIQKKKDSMTKNSKEPYKKCLSDWQNLLHEARQMKTEYTWTIEKIDKDLVSHANKIHEIVDKSLTKARNELLVFSESKITTLQAQEKAVSEKYEQFKTDFEQLEKVLQDCDISLLEHPLDIADMKALPPLVQQSPPSYTPGQIDGQVIMSMIGSLSTTVQNVKNDTTSLAGNPTSPVPRPYQFPTSLLPMPTVVSLFDSGYDCPSIACTTSSGLAWIRTDTERLQLMNGHGGVLESINTTFRFNDVTVTSSGDVVFTDWENKRIAVASKGATAWKIKTLFSTKYAPCGICLLRDGDVVVTFNFDNGHRVIQYSSKGAIRYKFNAKLFSDPHRVVANSINDNLYVVDDSKLLAFDKDHSLRYIFTGSDASSFHPNDVCTDSSGRVIVACKENNRIHVLEKDGKFLQYIQAHGVRAPLHIDVDSKGHVWIVEFMGQVKKVKYQR